MVAIDATANATGCHHNLEIHVSLMEEVPMYTLTVDAIQALQLSCSTTLSCKQGWAAYFFFHTPYLHQPQKPTKI